MTECQHYLPSFIIIIIIITTNIVIFFSWQAEMLGDQLASQLPDFQVEKSCLTAEAWPAFLAAQNARHGWAHAASPLVYKQLGPGNTAGQLVGGFTEFAAMIKEWYGVELPPAALDAVAEHVAANKVFASFASAGLVARDDAAPVATVCVTHASGKLAYGMLGMLASAPLPRDIRLVLLDAAEHADALQGLRMELIDSCAANIVDVAVSHDATAATADADLIVVTGATELGPLITAVDAVQDAEEVRVLNQKNLLSWKKASGCKKINLSDCAGAFDCG